MRRIIETTNRVIVSTIVRSCVVRSLVKVSLHIYTGKVERVPLDGERRSTIPNKEAIPYLMSPPKVIPSSERAEIYEQLA